MGSVTKLLWVAFLHIVLILPVWAEDTVIPLRKESGVYHLPVQLNGVITLDFVLDSGAAEVTLPADVVMTLVRTGTVSDADFLPGKTYSLADGSLVKSPRLTLRSVKIGNLIFRNVPAGIGDVEGHLLLGQSLLEKMDSWTLDQRNQVLIISSRQDLSTVIPTSSLESIIGKVTIPERFNLETPEGAVEGFFRSIAEKQFGLSWASLSSYSQTKIVQMVASEEDEASQDVIRELFDRNHMAVQNGFWLSFRNSSQIPDLVPLATFHLLDNRPGLATVQVRVGTETLNFNVYQEGKEWRLGLIESIEANQGFSKN